MNAVILCAGFATRMYPLTENFPKPLLQVAGRPVLDYLIDQVVALPGIQTVHIVTNDRFYGHFQDWYLNKSKSGGFGSASILIYNNGCVDNEHRLGAAGDLFLALEKIGKAGRILVSGGDNIYLFPIKPLWEQFQKGKVHCIPALIEPDLAKLQKTGVLELADDDWVTKLHEKPDLPPSTWTCPPLYFFQASVWQRLENFLATPGNHDAPGYFIDYLSQSERVQAIRLRSSRLDIGDINSYRQADLLLRKAPLDLDSIETPF
jgi:glucose-1-phosphate thymidylyltransferase